MITDMEMDLLKIQAKNLLFEVNREFQIMKAEGREDAQRPGLSPSTSGSGGESGGAIESSVPPEPVVHEASSGSP